MHYQCQNCPDFHRVEIVCPRKEAEPINLVSPAIAASGDFSYMLPAVNAPYPSSPVIPDSNCPSPYQVAAQFREKVQAGQPCWQAASGQFPTAAQMGFSTPALILPHDVAPKTPQHQASPYHGPTGYPRSPRRNPAYLGVPYSSWASRVPSGGARAPSELLSPNSQSTALVHAPTWYTHAPDGLSYRKVRYNEDGTLKEVEEWFGSAHDNRGHPHDRQRT
ncbi:hypothetical protein BV22DRAFT_460725 [Leucogyrophana mollusca]|uniref:Uncharacterized protein n=1 Tax=Leucogyrophana mollusca TaxID=85980 RepID=A0ACB8BI86_9AGAM|nr:hypothetical protein BV22DRAFT_460725 [Leucogyrophana mollusca]